MPSRSSMVGLGEGKKLLLLNSTFVTIFVGSERRPTRKMKRFHWNLIAPTAVRYI